MRINLFIAGLFFAGSLAAQDVVPKAKTKEQRKAERKKMTLEQKIEDTLPVDVTLPSARLKLPGNNDIKNLDDAKKALDNISSAGKNSIESLDEAKKYVSETIPNYGKDVKDRAKKTARILKKHQTKLFDGKNYKNIALTKKIWKSGSGSSQRYIEFYILKDHQPPLPYHRKMTWYEEKGKVKRFHHNVLTRDAKTNSLLHGPYKEYRGENLVKEGYYYLGVKDGRWMEYGNQYVLQNKETYLKGFYADSQISYYNGDSSKIREVIPVLHGKTTGDYYRFFEDGTLAEEGQYDSGKKIDLWIEYYDGGGHRRKKETQFPKDCYDPADSYVVREYDENKKVTFEHKKTN